jgi:peptidoglycan biosynthesis protein MviN/MurJ (putative lipid II flippase)
VSVPLLFAVGAMFLLVGFLILRLGVSDAMGSSSELFKITGVMVLMACPYVGLIIALDWGWVPAGMSIHDIERLMTFVMLCAVASFLWIA